jgi:hypothetical protein
MRMRQLLLAMNEDEMSLRGGWLRDRHGNEVETLGSLLSGFDISPTTLRLAISALEGEKNIAVRYANVLRSQNKSLDATLRRLRNEALAQTDARIEAFDVALEELETALRCSEGAHSWIDEVGLLPPDTRCENCGEEYGHPD